MGLEFKLPIAAGSISFPWNQISLLINIAQTFPAPWKIGIERRRKSDVILRLRIGSS